MSRCASIRRWSRFTRGGFQEHVFDGGHFYLVPQAKGVVALIRGRMLAQPIGDAVLAR